MHYISERTVIDLVTQEQVTKAVEDVFASMADGDAVNFPVVRERLGYADAIFGVKSAFDKTNPALGVKAGGLWPGNKEKGLPNHQSTIILFDPDTGEPLAFVCGTYLTALRTAAASAISIQHLARKDVKTLGILGAGGQAQYQVRAALMQRDFRRVVISDQSSMQSAALVQTLEDVPIDIAIASAEDMTRLVDVIITVTPSFQAIIKNDWVRPGTHIACMGADTKGKQELEPELVARAVLFGDEPAQAATIGECQHAISRGLIKQADIVSIGKVIIGKNQGRVSDEEITLFDGTGVGSQDLAAARVAVEIAITENRAVALDD